MFEDRVLIYEFNRGDKDSVRRIYEKYKDDILKLSIALLNNLDAAEDVVNDTFVTLTQSRGNIRITGNLKSYLTTCAVNQARRTYRLKQRQRTVGIDEAEHVQAIADSPDESAMQNEEHQRLCTVLAELPYAQREAVVLHIQDGMRFRHIAKVQNTSINTVKSRCRYGLAKLRSLLNGEV
ncbi:MAG: sigma-70 family RNA polymerase sigma factor [Planctomycetes bacterium]|nr:sigma-70 family RNA polymerase sigma factor [Planctomycetota bacterium]